MPAKRTDLPAKPITTNDDRRRRHPPAIGETTANGGTPVAAETKTVAAATGGRCVTRLTNPGRRTLGRRDRRSLHARTLRPPRKKQLLPIICPAAAAATSTRSTTIDVPAAADMMSASSTEMNGTNPATRARKKIPPTRANSVTCKRRSASGSGSASLRQDLTPLRVELGAQVRLVVQRPFARAARARARAVRQRGSPAAR
jgi:hypothetical protein